MTEAGWLPQSTYLCSYHGGMYQAPAGSVDRTKEVRCPDCAAATPGDIHDDAYWWYRRRWIMGA